jgi:hypothetical protein
MPAGVGISEAMQRVGLHRHCFCVPERADGDELHAFVSGLGAKSSTRC